MKEYDESLTDFSFEIKDFCVSVDVSNETSLYTLNAMIDTNGNAVSTVETNLSLDQGSMTSKHSFRTKSSIKVEELTSVVEEFNRLKAALTSKGN